MFSGIMNVSVRWILSSNVSSKTHQFLLLLLKKYLVVSDEYLLPAEKDLIFKTPFLILQKSQRQNIKFRLHDSTSLKDNNKNK